MKRKIKELEELASKMVGDGKSPNVFFITLQGVVVMITLDFNEAYHKWKRVSFNGSISHHPTVETTLEDRQYGCICLIQPEEDDSTKLIVSDEARQFAKRHRIKLHD